MEHHRRHVVSICRLPVDETDTFCRKSHIKKVKPAAKVFRKPVSSMSLCVLQTDQYIIGALSIGTPSLCE